MIDGTVNTDTNTAIEEPATAPVEPAVETPVLEPKVEPSLLSTNAENSLLSQNSAVDFSGIKLPEGSNYTDDELNSLKVFAAEQGFTPEQAQNVLNRDFSSLSSVKSTIEQDWQTTQEDWKQTLKEDKEYGGVNLNRTLRLAKTALDKFGNPELTKLLEDGVQHHPGIIKFLANVANAISEDSSIQKSTQTPKDVRQADIMFG